MNTKLFRNLALVFALSVSGYAYCWGVTGHRVIAEIAENNLSHRAKKNLKKIIGKQKLAYYANWPDFIKSDTTNVWKSTDQWHYVNISPQANLKSFSDSLKSQKAPNLYTQIQVLKSQIKDKNTAPKDREIALRFLIHLVGDLAQPMHAGRLEDLGGNRIKLKFFGDNTNLHSLWDSKLVDFQKYSYTEYARVLDVKTPQENKAIQSGTLEEWFFESHKAANSIYAYSKEGTNYSYDYNYRFVDLLDRQLLNGGLRLAAVLNEVLQ